MPSVRLSSGLSAKCPAVLWAMLALWAAPAAAEAPRVATDIPAVHSLASQVMAGVGEPELMIPAQGSPHGRALRPSEARALQEADLVFWVGPSLTPWLGEAIGTLAPEARSVTLEDAPGVLRLPAREEVVFADADGGKGRGNDDHDHGSGGHDLGDDHDHAGHDHAGHDHGGHDHGGHDHGGHDHGGHDHGASGFDPHLWLDPENAAAWVGAMAEALAAEDPANAARYRANAAEAESALLALTEEVEALIAPVRDRRFLVFHDAYQYFEARFDARALGAVRLSDASDPGAARVARLRDLVREEGVACVFAEPQFPPRLLDVIVEGTPAKAGTLDPVGAALEPGAGLYAELIRGLGRDLADCLR